jgi:hypothetical protein
MMDNHYPKACYLSVPRAAVGSPALAAARELLAAHNVKILPAPMLSLGVELHACPYDPASLDLAAQAAIVVLPFPDGAIGFDQYVDLGCGLDEGRDRPAFVLSPDGHHLTPAGNWRQEFVCLNSYNSQEYDHHYASAGYESTTPPPVLAGAYGTVRVPGPRR